MKITQLYLYSEEINVLALSLGQEFTNNPLNALVTLSNAGGCRRQTQFGTSSTWIHIRWVFPNNL